MPAGRPACPTRSCRARPGIGAGGSRPTAATRAVALGCRRFRGAYTAQMSDVAVKPPATSTPASAPPAEPAAAEPGWRRTFAALRHRDFALLMASALPHMTAMGMGMTAFGYLAFELTGS